MPTATQSLRCIAMSLALIFALHATPALASNDAIVDSLEKSREEKKGVTLTVNGQSIAIVVSEVGAKYVIGRNQQFDRVVVRIEKIDAVSM